ncbi:MAG: hypothetical protein H7Y37_12885 [Anaerolineae bacterium]|nr:hypothetical protein [Gloeobacterales cyanobacterium ES-bin-313]
MRERHYPLAEQCFARVAAWLDSPELLDETRLVCRTFLMQSASYLDYCCGDYKEARRKTLEGLHADDVLENRHGYEILLVHRLQFALNLVRISARTGRCRRAVALACRILVFLGTQPLAPPLPGQWNDAHLAALPAELVSKLCQQVVSELATLLVAVDPKQRERFWSILQPWLSRMLFQECCPRAYTWLRLKSALLAGDDQTFLELGLEYMRAGRSELPLLWYSTVFEILAFAKRQCLPGAQRMHAQVQLDSKTWQDLPDEWKLPA